jgi:hypothetical protein
MKNEMRKEKYLITSFLISLIILISILIYKKIAYMYFNETTKKLYKIIERQSKQNKNRYKSTLQKDLILHKSTLEPTFEKKYIKKQLELVEGDNRKWTQIDWNQHFIQKKEQDYKFWKVLF